MGTESSQLREAAERKKLQLFAKRYLEDIEVGVQPPDGMVFVLATYAAEQLAGDDEGQAEEITLLKQSCETGIFWDIKPKLIDGEEDGILVEMQWGWTAWMTPEESAMYADDSPKGFERVVITLEQAKWLRDELTRLIHSEVANTITEARAAAIIKRDEKNKRLSEMFE